MRKHPLLLAPLHARLKADQVVVALGQVLLPQLHDRPGPAAVGRAQSPTGFIGPKRRVSTPRRAISSIGRQPSKKSALLEVVERQHLGLDDRLVEGEVLLARRAARSGSRRRRPCRSARPRRARSMSRRLGLDDRRDRVVEVEVLAAEQRLERARRAPARSAGPVASTTSPAGQLGDLVAPDLDRGWAASAAVIRAAKRSRSTARALARGHRGGAARAAMISEPKRSISRLSSPAGVVGVVAAQRVRAHELGEGRRSSAPASARPGRISWRTTGTPRCASCQAHSLPARPPPTTCTAETMRLL